MPCQQTLGVAVCFVVVSPHSETLDADLFLFFSFLCFVFSFCVFQNNENIFVVLNFRGIS